MCKKSLTSICFINELGYKYSRDVFRLIKIIVKHNDHEATQISAVLASLLSLTEETARTHDAWSSRQLQL